MRYALILLLLIVVPAAQAYTLEILETNPSPVRTGEYADVTVRLTSSNIEEDGTKKVVFFVEENSDLRPISGQESKYSDFKPGQSVTKTFRIFFNDELPAGNIPITFIVSENDVELKIIRDVFVKGSLRIPELYIGSLKSVPDDLLQDTDNNKIIITLQNLGDKDAELITAELIDVSGKIVEANSYSMRDTIGKLEGGEEEALEFSFDIEKTSVDIIDASLRLRFRVKDELTDSYQTVNENLDLMIPLTKAPELSIIKVEPTGEVLVGKKENEIIVTIFNSGKEDAESVRLRLYPDPSQPFDFEKNNYFLSPKIDIGENASIKIVFDVLGDAVIDDYNFDVQLESIVGTSRLVEPDTLTIDVTGEQFEGSSLVRLVIIIVSVSIALLLGIFSLVKRKK